MYSWGSKLSKNVNTDLSCVQQFEDSNDLNLLVFTSNYLNLTNRGSTTSTKIRRWTKYVGTTFLVTIDSGN